uniref:Uncharacterized protein n=1 Tax=Polytomella parva TaxID=51329 RepID=A0A7S0YJY1_9CHLO|mmetsp:Transcript_30319/g.55404  ORF Transcript_30319/g.55404 Transcript_30319/m.55404 type:complete len:393 (+) Transcript_30319:117-1295(+)|eukprot:CAMPEP_0175048284 /NCGR_PEP_ID=MMETSP0052_2-20121109/6103_1 /TAXON_ID=51329 ORGANISM="Polytomella parva, Strain SAG 63-3" /NCGR_SAMPLE_ID=MMETSP0052_2 /ASSEMBLY_ACC=CAM_ASM_000194 /LENGTH=392 /DNA_ID=CAMNT_0016312329 /DNA_START=18 /DNA_END=1196 /DNA_ORIENTATION=+
MLENVRLALLLTFLGALGTTLGGLIVVIQPLMDFKRLGHLQGIAGGLMLSISMFDLFPSSIESIGFAAANIWFFVGALFFAVIIAFVPEPSPESFVYDFCKTTSIDAPSSESVKARLSLASSEKNAPEKTKSSSSALNSTNPIKRLNAGKKISSDAPPPSAGSSPSSNPPDSSSMSSHLKDDALSPTSSPTSTHSAAASLNSSSLTPSPTSSPVNPSSTAFSSSLESTSALEAKRQRVLLSGLITALGIALHNFPEGVAVFFASFKSPAIGASLAFAIALHNVPEGIAVALPVFFASGSRMKGFKYAFVSGLAEPLAVVLLALFFPANMNQYIVEALLAAVGGVMAFLALHELLPLSIEHAGSHAAVMCLFAGMAIMSFNLYLLDHWLGHKH